MPGARSYEQFTSGLIGARNHWSDRTDLGWEQMLLPLAYWAGRHVFLFVRQEIPKV